MAGLKEIKNNIKTYEYKDGFLIDIIDRGDLWDVWLYHNDIYVKDYMFGLYKKYFENYGDFLECVYNNLENEGYITFYNSQYNEEYFEEYNEEGFEE